MQEGRKEEGKEGKENKQDKQKKKQNHYKLQTEKCTWEKCILRFVEAEETHA
jgi:hypothetical protein